MYCTLVKWPCLDWFKSTSQFRLGDLSQSCPKSPNRRRCKKVKLHWNMEITSQLYVTYCVIHKIVSNSLGFSASLAFSALTLLVGRQEGHPACKKTEWWSAGMVICLEQGADLHMAQLIPLPLTVSCFSKIQIGFTFLVPAHPGSPGKRAVKRVCVCVFHG